MLKDHIKESLAIYTIKYRHRPYLEEKTKQFEFNIVATSITDAIEQAKVLPHFKPEKLESIRLNCIAMKLKP